LYAHNGGKFDSIILFDLFIDLKDEDVIIQPMFHDNSIYKLIIKYKNKTIEIRDSYPLLAGSLSDLYKSYGFSDKKGNFPHKFINRTTINHVGDKPDIKYFENISVEEYENIPKIFDTKKMLLNYLIEDCKGLYNVIKTFREEIKLEFSIDPLNSMTIASLALKI
jgi:hypothetical protein